MQKLLESGKAVAIFEKKGSKVKLRSEDVLRLINFLQYVSYRYRLQSLTMPQLYYLNRFAHTIQACSQLGKLCRLLDTYSLLR
jgi:hypothetical protein